jgi:type VI secretion system protein VasJ
MPTFREEVVEKLAPLLAPIAGANPAGADISYDPDFEIIKAEIDKLSSVDNSEPSWGKIEQLGASLLASKGKDLRVVSWMTVAKVKTSSWRGFAESLVLYHGLANTFWETMFPEARRARARLNAIAWMADMVNQHMLAKDVVLSDGDAVRTCDEVLNELDRIFADKLGDAYVGPGQLRSLMRDKVRSIPEPPPEAPPPVDGAVDGASAQQQDGAATQAAAPAKPLTPTSPGDVDAALADCARIMCESAAVLRSADRTSAWAFVLNRRGTWFRLKHAPSAKDGKTRLSPPDSQVVSELEQLGMAENWGGLLAAAEAQLNDNPFWLDLHRYVVVAMDNLGSEYGDAKEGVLRELASFLLPMPELVAFSFKDGTAFAEAPTQKWLGQQLAKYGGGGGGGGAAAAAAAISAEDEEIAKRFEEASKLVESGKVAEGLAIGVALADRSADARLRFRARLSVGKMALDAAKHDLARGMFEHLMSDVERHGLEVWEPATCATLYSYLFAATREVSRAKGGSPDLVAREQYLFDKLCRLDPASAIRLSG